MLATAPVSAASPAGDDHTIFQGDASNQLLALSFSRAYGSVRSADALSRDRMIEILAPDRSIPVMGDCQIEGKEH